MRQVDIDASSGGVRAQAGALAGDIANAVAVHGLAPVLGLASSLGAVGLSLNGGVGWLSWRHGFACHNVRAIDVVLSDGQRRTVNPDNDPLHRSLDDVLIYVLGAGMARRNRRR